MTIKKPDPLNGYKWIMDKNYGRAYFKGYYEPALTKYITDTLTNESCFLDIGAHAGYFSLLAASIAQNGKVIVFEPEVNNFEFIEKIKQLNKIENWTLVNAAVGLENGHLRFKKGQTSSTGLIDAEGDVIVNQVSLDNFFEKEGIQKIDLIKIDVEGYGGNVLTGGVKIINRFKPIILFEIHEGSNEFITAWNLFSENFIFYNFETMQKIDNSDSEDYKFIIIKPKIIG